MRTQRTLSNVTNFLHLLFTIILKEWVTRIFFLSLSLISQKLQACWHMNAYPSLSRINQEQTLRHSFMFPITLHIPQNIVSSILDESKLREYLKYNWWLKKILVRLYFKLIYVTHAMNDQTLGNQRNIIGIHWIA